MILRINDRFTNRKIEFFNNFTLSLKHDSCGSEFSFSYVFDPNNPAHKELACIAHYHECTVEHNGELLLTGFAVSQGFKNESTVQLATTGGYSLPGVLDDCQIPPSLYPLQSDGLSLKQIAEKLIKPFELKMVIDPLVADRMNKVFKTSTASETQTIKSYLTDLATQKNIIISHTEKGELLFTESKTNQKPILKFDDTNRIPGTEVDLVFDGQMMHSHITVVKQAGIDGGNAGEHTIRNPYVFTVYRPKVVTQTSGDDIDTELFARMELANELRGLKLTIETDRWEVDGKILKPNNIITVISPRNYLFKESKWFIESIDFVGDNEKTTATLHCVLPEVYTKEMPVYLFKGINIHAQNV